MEERGEDMQQGTKGRNQTRFPAVSKPFSEGAIFEGMRGRDSKCIMSKKTTEKKNFYHAKQLLAA